MKYYVIYALKHDSDVIYVGCTIRPLKKRLSSHFAPSSRCRLVREYVSKYGGDAITIEPLSQHSDKAVAETIEAHYVQKWSPCCNATPDGQGGSGKSSAETRAKMSAASSGENNAFYGKTHSAETRAKISAAGSGENHPNYGKTFSAEHRAKISKTKRSSVWQHSDEIVHLYNGKEFSQREIADKFGCSRRTIRRIIKASKA